MFVQVFAVGYGLESWNLRDGLFKPAGGSLGQPVANDRIIS